ncbi:misacylated tRNA(Ala) deacylase [Loktanella sp. DSM 29012]|uniref:alanyl-tRNA editing protein n=1 Tax=Loktanella sp. DSM 29012 TaxID=1881056 RepID=UPI0008AB804B|nr:alanyl-tRNA editing protein [Loktanella sp. DSM 29012]SEQ20089.1 misacylated tRNA(Ala) deacylase [Loktanella sp. DSM 29012]
MTTALYLDDAYQRQAEGRVTALTAEGGIVLNASLFYPTAGGQPGDSGHLEWQGRRLMIATAIKGTGDDIVLVPAEPAALPPVGTHVTQTLDWERRHRLMRMHTALHLLSVVIPRPVTGGQIAEAKGRLDFDMQDPPDDRDGLTDRLNGLIAADLPVTWQWITQAELDSQPELIKTLSVKPPRGADQVRLVQIGQGADQIDLQPCGGTHVRSTIEIGALRLGKIEKKGRQNRRVYLHLEDG